MRSELDAGPNGSASNNNKCVLNIAISGRTRTATFFAVGGGVVNREIAPIDYEVIVMQVSG